MQENILLPTLVYGSQKPEIRFGLHKGRQVVFCLNNGNLHLTENDLDYGTYEAGAFFGRLCREHCWPAREGLEPCPAFARSYEVGTQNEGLAGVELHFEPRWQKCAGVQSVLETELTDEERFFLLAYLSARWSDEHKWRNALVRDWNTYWHDVPNGWGNDSRTGKFDRMLWSTLRYPALIPQVWLNWFYAGPEDLTQRLKHGEASRVDFVSFAHGERHVIEIDGPSHYAAWSQRARCYIPDEQEYARNLKIQRWLEREGWRLTRIGRWEVREAMNGDGIFDHVTLISALPFGKTYPGVLNPEELGVVEIWRPPDVEINDCPF